MTLKFNIKHDKCILCVFLCIARQIWWSVQDGSGPYPVRLPDNPGELVSIQMPWDESKQRMQMPHHRRVLSENTSQRKHVLYQHIFICRFVYMCILILPLVTALWKNFLGNTTWWLRLAYSFHSLYFDMPTQFKSVHF